MKNCKDKTSLEVIEIISFKQKINTTLKDAEIGFKVLNKFYSDFDGYQRMDIAKYNDNGWILVLKWSSIELEERASQSMMKSEKTGSFKMIVDVTSVDKKLYPVYSA